MRTLVIGGGIAGQAVVEALVEQDDLTLVCAEARLPYDRVALSTLLTTKADPDTLTIRPQSWYDDHKVDVLVLHELFDRGVAGHPERGAGSGGRRAGTRRQGGELHAVDRRQRGQMGPGRPSARRRARRA